MREFIDVRKSVSPPEVGPPASGGRQGSGDAATASPVLTAEEIHLWRFGLDPATDEAGRLEAWLSPDERDRASRLRRPELRERFVAGRGRTRELLASYLRCEPDGVRFRYGRHGKPELDAAGGVAPVAFNLSHSADRAVLAVAAGPRVGVDIERVRPLSGADWVVESFFSPAEIAEYSGLPPSDRLLAFYHGWTRKEAFLKARGGGLSDALRSFDVSLAPGSPPRLLRVEGDPEAAATWSLYDFDAGPGYVGTLAVEGQGYRL